MSANNHSCVLLVRSEMLAVFHQAQARTLQGSWPCETTTAVADEPLAAEKEPTLSAERTSAQAAAALMWKCPELTMVPKAPCVADSELSASLASLRSKYLTRKLGADRTLAALTMILDLDASAPQGALMSTRARQRFACVWRPLLVATQSSAARC